MPERGDERASLGQDKAESGALAPTNVPEPVSELIGRDDDLAEVVNLMGAHRLVTLTGPGGIGKTQLGLLQNLILGEVGLLEGQPHAGALVSTRDI